MTTAFAGDFQICLRYLSDMKTFSRSIVMISMLLFTWYVVAAEPESKPDDNNPKSETPPAKQHPALADDLYEGPAAARPAAEPPMMTAKRWPVQILSAIYGTGGKNADVTAKVQDYVEKSRGTFSANPVDLGADPNPGWNKSLHIVYMKDGVRREQRRNENETILPESFYGPQDAAELKAWLSETRWIGAEPDIQFHADQTFTSPGSTKSFQWEALTARKVRLLWAEDRKVDFVFDYTWSNFSDPEHGSNVHHLKK